MTHWNDRPPGYRDVLRVLLGIPVVIVVLFLVLGSFACLLNLALRVRVP